MKNNLELTDISCWTTNEISPWTYDYLNKLSNLGLTRIESINSCHQFQSLLQKHEHEKAFAHFRCSQVVSKQTELTIPERCTDISVQFAVTDSFSGTYFNHSPQDQLDYIVNVCENARSVAIPVRVYIHCAFICPFDGDVSPQKVTGYIAKLFRAGCNEFFLVDSTGTASAEHSLGLIHVMSNQIPKSRSGFLFAKQNPTVSENIETAISSGFNKFCCAVLPDHTPATCQ